MKVYNCLKQFDLDLMFSMALEDEGGDPVEIPLRLNGIIQYITTQYPTEEEMENCCHVVVTSDEPWDPYSKDFEENKRATQVHDHYRVLEVISRCNMVILAVTSEAKGDLFDHLQDMVTGLRIEESGDKHQIASVLTEVHTLEITEEVLTKWWGIGLETVKQTIKVTTQAGVWTMVRPVERTFWTRRNQLKFLTLNHLIYSDTMFPKVLSVQKMNYTQVYMDTLGWDNFHPMKSRSEASESLNCFVKENQWISRTIITDGAMEEKGRNQRVNCIKWGITQQFTKPYNPWQNHVEQTVLELKKQINHFTR